MNKDITACDENSVGLLYKNSRVAEEYIQRRFSFSWSNFLHQRQVAEVNRVICNHHPGKILELAPGPARIAADLKGVSKGLMIEYSQEMIKRAKLRLKLAGLDSVWDLRHGNAFHLDEFQNKFDFLYTFRFIRHFKIKERERLYHNIYTCLKPDGFFMLDVVNRFIREKLDVKNDNKPKGELDVYDMTYSEKEFREEINTYGFEVLSMTPLLSLFELQSWLSYKFDKYINKLIYMVVFLLERIPSQNPLEWVALCRKA